MSVNPSLLLSAFLGEIAALFINAFTGLPLRNLFKSIRNIIINEKNDQKTNTNKEESYLSQAIDMIDLERRQKELDRRFIRKF